MPQTLIQTTDYPWNVVKGAFPGDHQLDKTLEATVYGDDLRDDQFVRGRVVSIDPTTGKWVLGCAAKLMPYWIVDGFTPGQWDTIGVIHTSLGRTVNGDGKWNALCGKGDYEMYTNQYLGTGWGPFGTRIKVYNTADADQGKIQVWTAGVTSVGLTSPFEFGRKNSALPLGNPGKEPYQKNVIQLICFLEFNPA